MSKPRRVIKGATYLLTRRCMGRRFGLVPRGMTPELFGYCVALAAKRHGILIHAIMVLSNHWHALLTDPHGKLPDFCRDVHALVGRALNAHLGRWEAFWSSQRVSLVETEDPEDVWEKLVYTATNPVKDGLVKKASDWPGLRTSVHDVTREPRQFKRPKIRFFRRSKLPEQASLKLSVPPQFQHLGKEEFARQFSERVQRHEAKLRAQRKEEGKSYLGAHAIMRQSRDDSPNTKELRRGLDPAIATKDRKRRIARLSALRTFRNAYQEARLRWLDEEPDVIFPAGTYLLSRCPGIVCAEPHPKRAGAA